MTNWLVSPFFNEAEVFEIKLRELGDWADVIVVVEGDRTYAGERRMLQFPRNDERWAPWANKIRYLSVEMPIFEGVENKLPSADFQPVDNGAWRREELLRESPLLLMDDLDDHDVVFLSDADEIVKPEVLLEAASQLNTNVASEVIRFNLPQHVLHLNWRWTWEPQAVARICRGATLRENGVQAVVRSMERRASVWPGRNLGWHFSYMGGRERVIHKLRNAAHIELAVYGTTDNVARCMVTGEDLFGREDCQCVSVIDGLPEGAFDGDFGWMFGPSLGND